MAYSNRGSSSKIVATIAILVVTLYVADYSSPYAPTVIIPIIAPT